MNSDNAISILYIIIFFPVICSLFVAFLPEKFSKFSAWAGTLIPLILSAVLLIDYNNQSDPSSWTSNDYYLFHSIDWFTLPGFSIQFTVGLDGISILLNYLAILLFPLIILFTSNHLAHQKKLYYSMLLIMETGVLGFFLSLDLFFFYVFFEMVLIPTYFFIGIWGGESKKQAALKFFLYTIVGSFLMLMAILYLGLNAVPGEFTTDYLTILNQNIDFAEQIWLFLGFFIAFAIKVPIFPLHTWQPITYSSSSTTGTIILAALLSKMGAYGLIRFCLPLFPLAAINFAPVISGLAVAGIIYGALLAVGQQDIKRLFAYSSFSHLGFIVLGIFAFNNEALTGSVFHMVGHGISVAGLFFLIDYLERTLGTKNIHALQGIANFLPTFSFAFMICILSSVGLPGLNGFVGEFLILLGAYSSSVISHVFAIIAALAMILAAVYLFDMFRKIMFGRSYEEIPTSKPIQDLPVNASITLTILIVFMFILGIYSGPFLNIIEQDLIHVLPYISEVLSN